MSQPTTTARLGRQLSLPADLDGGAADTSDFTLKPHPTLKPQLSTKLLASPTGSHSKEGFNADSFISTIKSPRHITLGSPSGNHTARFPVENRVDPTTGKMEGPGPGSYGAPMPPRLVKGSSVRFGGRELFGSIDYAARSSATTVPGPGTYSNVDSEFTRGGLSRQAPALKGRIEEKPRAVDVPAPDYYQGADAAGVMGARPLSTQPSLRGPRFNIPAATVPRISRTMSAGSIGPGQYFDALQQDRNLSTRPTTPSFSLFGRREALKSPSATSPTFRMPVGSCGAQPLSTKKTAPAPALKGRSAFGGPYAAGRK